MIELVYMSQAQHIFSEPELVELLEISRANNTNRGITGMLLYNGSGTFVQAIEGDQQQIDQLFTILSQDRRHSDIQQLAYSQVHESSFSDWKMGYKRLTGQDFHDLSGFSTFMEPGHGQGTLSNSNSSFGLELLNHFRQVNG